jgi:hypothetical protein
VAQAGAAGRPIEATLDDMYVPLRLGEGYDLRELTKGHVLTPQNLRRLKQPLAIRGPAGSGKTTWMRWMFRRLLRDDKTLPLMVELRRLARIWYTPGRPDPERFLDAYLEDLVVDQVGEAYRGRLTEILSEPGKLQPVLLVDGWDELGELGEELRRKLVGFMQAYPRVRVVVTSRPYGQGRPSHSEGFQVLDIQPLSNGEIEDLARRFFTHCYGEEQRRVHETAADFLQALQRSPDASALARRPLLLTMMLLVSRSRPLPDQRHQLYQLCIENLLTALPDRRHQEGALLLDYHWRPENSQERFREVARLAFRAQTEAFQERPTDRTAIGRTWDEMARLLPEHWSAAERTGFLAWLAGPAGVLTDQADGTLAFTHLSFQEYLAAWQLKVLSQISILGVKSENGSRKFNDLQTPKLSKKQLCDRTSSRVRLFNGSSSTGS